MLFTPPPCVLQIVGNRVLHRVAFEETRENGNKSLAQIRNEVHLQSNFPSGLITRKIRQRMTRIVDVWLKAMYYAPVELNYYKKHQPTFVTLTLPARQMHTDKELHNKALNRFTTSLQRSHKVEYYLWRAERQQNGNIHYHIIIDKYVSWELIRATWNNILNLLGYIEAYRIEQQEWHKNGFRLREDLLSKWSAPEQGKAYAEGVRTNWSNPNSTDIHKLKNVEDTTSYICKYVTKDEEYKEYLRLKRAHTSGELSDEQFATLEGQMLAVLETKKINGRCWGCSDELRTLKEPRLICGNKEDAFFSDVIADEESRILIGDTYTIAYCKNIKEILKRHKALSRQIASHYRDCYKWLYCSPIYTLFEPKPPDVIIEKKIEKRYQMDLFYDTK